MNPANNDFAPVQKTDTALARDGKPEEVAAAVAFLTGEDASFVTGTTLSADEI